MNKQEKQTNKNSQTQTTVWYLPEGREMGEQQRVKGLKYMVAEEDLILVGGHRGAIYR